MFIKKQKGFTLIELLVVIAIIGMLALYGLRVYSGMQEKAKNAIVKANVGTIQTLIQAELADSTTTEVYDLWEDGTLVDDSGIHNPVDGAAQTTYPITIDASEAGEVWVSMTSDVFQINGNDASATDTKVYTTDLKARK